MEIQRCYDILELPFGVSLAEVNDQWKTLAKIFLNDRAGFVPGTKEYEFALRKMQDINQAHAILKNWLEHSANSSSGSAPARRPKPQPPAADRKRQRSNPETERQGSNGRSKQTLPLLYPPFQPNAIQTLIDKMENGNEFVRTALLLLAILLLFTPLLLFPLLATAMGEKPAKVVVQSRGRTADARSQLPLDSPRQWEPPGNPRRATRSSQSPPERLPYGLFRRRLASRGGRYRRDQI